MRPCLLAALLVLSFQGSAIAQEQPDPIKGWVAADWAAKAEFLGRNGGTAERDCEEGDPSRCVVTTTADVTGWTLTMESGPGTPAERVFCIGKTGGRLRWCKDDATGETQKFFRSGDDWIPHGG